MNPCEAHRDELLEAVLVGAADPSPELAAHVAACVPCSAEQARHARLAQGLGGLVRRSAPAALDARIEAELAGRPTERAVSSLGILRRPPAPAQLAGLVVSAMNAGHRQDRAAAWVVGLARKPAPGELDGLVRDLPARRPAPEVLDRLVAEELADPAKSMTSRFLGRLERRSAPGGLERRLIRARADGDTPSRAITAGGRLAVVSSVLAAALIAWLGLTRTPEPAPQAPHDLADLALEFRVERVRSIEELGPIARGLVGLVSDVEALDLGEAR